ncbi:hypothetical protein C8R45DRAFT_1096501 [Mycena sanguinolenta]|nr:hypothetical protein C8R45DRAFT_1096501 [Mycena sanguinolenta]
MFNKLLTSIILAIFVLQGAVSTAKTIPCGKDYEPPCPKGQYCCIPGPIVVGAPKPGYCTPLDSACPF